MPEWLIAILFFALGWLINSIFVLFLIRKVNNGTKFSN